jgi:uncharacterized protein
MSASVDLPPGSLADEHFVVLDEAECYRLLAGENVGRVVYTDGALPAITPVNYALSGRRILFRTVLDSRLAHGVIDAVVAFEVDHLDSASSTGWSVVVTGVGRPFTPGADAAAPDVRPWVGGERNQLVCITPGRITGRRIG